MVGISLKATYIFGCLTLLLTVISIKQLTGYSYWETVWRILVAIIPFIVLTLVLFIGGFIGLYLYTRVRYA